MTASEGQLMGDPAKTIDESDFAWSLVLVGEDHHRDTIRLSPPRECARTATWRRSGCARSPARTPSSGVALGAGLRDGPAAVDAGWTGSRHHSVSAEEVEQSHQALHGPGGFIQDVRSLLDETVTYLGRPLEG